jgi:hypothetical protein
MSRQIPRSARPSRRTASLRAISGNRSGLAPQRKGRDTTPTEEETQTVNIPHALVRLSEVKAGGKLFADFCAKHSDWIALKNQDAPVYRLPEVLVSSLARPKHRKGPIITKQQAATEIAFSRLCDNLNGVGFHEGTAISYPYLQTRPEGPAPEVMKQLGCTAEQQTAMGELLARTQNMQHRLKGYVGWLVLDPDFCAARDRLIQIWNSLSAHDRPRFPLTSIIAVPGNSLQEVTSEELIYFQNELRGFLTHWGLTGMATWDLPMPQGPLIPALMSRSAPSMPKHGLHIVLPVHYPLTRDDLLVEQIRFEQEQIAAEAGLDLSIAGLSHFDSYGKMFEVYHLESIVHQRYGRKGGGFVLTLENCLADHFGVALTQLQKWRNAISAIRRGKRSRIPWLRVKSGSSPR